MVESAGPDAGATFTWEAFVAGDGYRWAYRRFEPDGPARAQVVCLHGIQSHAGWYGGLGEHLRRAGYRVFFPDRRGSGRNRADRGDAPSFRRLLDDVIEFGRTLRPAGLPLVLAGISWGGRLAAALPYRGPGLFDALALLCPGIFSKVGPPVGDRLAMTVARVLAPRRMFPIPLSDPALFTASPEWRRFIADDPLALRRATARLLMANVGLSIYLRRARRRLRMPVSLQLAGRDQVIDNQRVRRYVKEAPTATRAVIEYPEAHHTLEFEPQPQRYREDLRRWLDRTVQP